MDSAELVKKSAIVTALSIVAATSSLAQPLVVGHDGHVVSFSPIAPPALLKWELATATDQRVELTIMAQALGAVQQHFAITQANAAQFGVDWSAWQSAAVDPLFTRSLVTFGDTTRESAISRNFDFDDPFRLDQIGINLHDYGWPSGPPGRIYSPFVTVGAVSNINVPEPTTLVIAALLLTMSRIRNPAGGRR